MKTRRRNEMKKNTEQGARRCVKSAWEEFASLIPPSIKKRLAALTKRIEEGERP